MSEFKRGLFQPIDYPPGARFLCVHRWKMTEPMPRTGHDGFTCLKCGAKSSSSFGAVPDFMTYLLPFFLTIGAIGGFMVATRWTPAVFIASLSAAGLVWWVREILR